MKFFLQIDSSDNVAVALDAADARQALPSGALTLEPIPAGHKAALRDIKQGEAVVKYGAPIGIATRHIAAGEWVHTHNLASGLEADEEYSYAKSVKPALSYGPAPTFEGYLRADGQVGIRNELWVLPTVGCVSHTARLIADAAKRVFPEAFTDCVGFSHPYGCSQSGDDAAQTRKLIAALARHPNAGAVVLLGLGCEVNRLCDMPVDVGERENVVAFNAQDVGDEVAHALALLRPLAEKAKADRRQTFSIEKLRVGLKCGGSDGYSGLTANPLLGALCDRVTAHGGSCGMTEVPEMFGAERELMKRAHDKGVFNDIVEMINSYKQYFRDHALPVYDNPSPGNREGGITTLEEKSLGCTHKAGNAEVMVALPYAELVKRQGLSLITGPGNDLVACTALAAAGCQLVLFTTGRGTPYGGPVPTVKISTNASLAGRKPSWIDFSADALLSGASMDDMTDELLRLVLGVASGTPTKAEIGGYREIAILKGGVTQ